ncbi:MAG: hypothetical protein QUU85_08200 [Candidatus Eisenbacteria bacterium]|nr:hypothetical protein [Candidatus Eisenbacteria bacterium]
MFRFRIAPALSIAVLGLILAGLLGASAASAQDMGFRGWGVRAGLSSDPDQFVVGMHLNLGELAENLRFVPNTDIGFGDDLTVFTLNPELNYVLGLPEAGNLYFGGALGFVYTKLDTDIDLDVDGDGDDDIDDSDTDVGIAGVIGYEPPTEDLPIFFDLKIGITDEYPDLKFMVGYTFGAGD